MRFLVTVFLLVSSFYGIRSQNTAKPKLVVGIVVDQMRFDYLTRFGGRFGDEGFNRLLNDGFNCKNHHFNYMPTYTGPGHASIYTGTTPENHGIIANNWYDKFLDSKVYCVSDTSVTSLGTKSKKDRMSPKRMLATTFADAIRLHTQFQSKTIGISIKDRGAILPAGHTANFAFWFHGKSEGNWVSSSYYADTLPNWVTNFNNNQSVDKYLKTWKTLYPLNTYVASGKDDSLYEKAFVGEKSPTFPHELLKLMKINKGYDILKTSPFGNTMVTDFAIETLINENLGQDAHTDVLAISYSSTDYIGHTFGVNSVELEDTYLRLDLELGRLFKELDNRVGAGNYTVFLTADHGVVQVPRLLQDHKIPAGYIDFVLLKAEVATFLKQTFKIDDLLSNISSQQVFLNYEVIEKNNLELSVICKKLQHFLIQHPQMLHVFTREQLSNRNMTSLVGQLVQNGFHQRRSGDLAFVLNPATISGNANSNKGTTHGSPQAYDTHVPLLFYGKGIKKGSTYTKTQVTDIAPTISALLGIALPNACTGNVLNDVID